METPIIAYHQATKPYFRTCARGHRRQDMMAYILQNFPS